MQKFHLSSTAEQALERSTRSSELNTPATLIVQHIESWSLDRVRPFAANARTHSREQIAQIAASITQFGFVNPILVGTDSIIVAGHARLLAAQHLGMSEVPVIVLGHLSEVQRRALVLADNQLAENAGWDEEKLRMELASLQQEGFPVELIGFEEEELSQLLAAEDTAAGLTDEDEIPALAESPVTSAGDLWKLGEHKLLCDDALEPAALARLMAGEEADLIFNDPPFNVDYQGYTRDRLRIAGDRMSPDQYRHFLSVTCTNYRRIMKPAASVYVCHASCWQREWQNALEEAGFAVRCQIIWAKQTFAWGFARYKFRHEPIYYAHVAGQKDHWYGDRAQSTLWEENKPAANRDHPTAKPVALAERALKNSSRPGDLIVDLFGGSGSTVIACERLGRKGRLMEIDARYSDVIVRRWQDYTGRLATLDGDGGNFQEIAAHRRPQQGSQPEKVDG